MKYSLIFSSLNLENNRGINKNKKIVAYETIQSSYVGGISYRAKIY